MAETTYIDLQESTLKNIWRIAWPVMVSSVLATTLTTVDMFWIGKLGAREVAAVALSGSVWFVVGSFAQVIAAGTLALVARYAGGRRSAELSLALGQSPLLALAVAVPIGGLGWRFAPTLLGFFGAEAQVLALGIPYLRVLFSGAVFVYLSIIAFTTMYALGDTRTPMRITMITTGVNILLDPLLIFGWLSFPRLGVLGAGVATLVAYGLSSALSLGILPRRGILKFARPGFHPATAAKILRVGLPASLHAITRPLTGALMFKIVAYFGTAGIAAFGIGGRALGLMFIYLEGLGAAARTLVGQNLGAGLPERAEEVVRRVLSIGLLIQGLFTLIYFLLAPQIIAVFNAEEGVVRVGTSYLQITALSLLFVVFIITYGGAQQGAGDTRPPMFASLVANWAVKLPLAYFVAYHLNAGPTGVWLAIGASVLVEALVVSLYYRRGGWKRKEL